MIFYSCIWYERGLKMRKEIGCKKERESFVWKVGSSGFGEGNLLVIEKYCREKMVWCKSSSELRVVYWEICWLLINIVKEKIR